MIVIFEILHMSLEVIASKIRVCTLCTLHKNRILAVPGEGPLNAELIFVGEGPGANEDIKGKPFVGSSGKYLDKLLHLISLNRKDVFIVNIVKCRPPGNRAPSLDERNACLPYLKEQILTIKPYIICTLGKTALETLTGETSISKVHGKLINKDNIEFFPLYHPAAALYNPALRSILESDMYKLKNILSKPKKHNPFVNVDTNLDSLLS